MPFLRGVLALSLMGVALSVVPASAAAAEAEQVTWHGTQIKMYGAQSAGKNGAGVTVAVLDGWIDRSHPDFQGRALAGGDCRSGTCKAGEVEQNCGSQHGTHVAGTVGSSSYGVAPKATILPVQVLSSDSKGECTGTPAAVAAGIQYAVAHGAKVLNLSLGPDVSSSSNSVLSSAVHAAAQAGAVLVFSAGNKDSSPAQSYGADAVIVAATGPSGALASYSERGTGVNVAAPGGQPNSANVCSQSTCVTSLYPGDAYAVAAGTSMAAPHVAGLAALLFAQAPGRSRATVIAKIESTATPLAQAGSGLINVKAALGVSTGTTKPTPSPTAAHTTSPKPVVTHSATPSQPPATTSATPSATPSPRPAAATAAPSVSPTPSDSASPLPTAPALANKADTKPAHFNLLAILAGALVVVMALAVGGLGRRT